MLDTDVSHTFNLETITEWISPRMAWSLTGLASSQLWLFLNTMTVTLENFTSTCTQGPRHVYHYGETDRCYLLHFENRLVSFQLRTRCSIALCIPSNSLIRKLPSNHCIIPSYEQKLKYQTNALCRAASVRFGQFPGRGWNSMQCSGVHIRSWYRNSGSCIHGI
jgi:hypothetical protein